MLPISGKDKILIVRQTVKSVVDDDAFIVYKVPQVQKQFQSVLEAYVAASLDQYQQRHALVKGEVLTLKSTTAVEHRWRRAAEKLANFMTQQFKAWHDRPEWDGTVQDKPFDCPLDRFGKPKISDGLDFVTHSGSREIKRYFQDILETKYGWIIEPMLIDRSADPHRRVSHGGYGRGCGN